MSYQWGSQPHHGFSSWSANSNVLQDISTDCRHIQLSGYIWITRKTGLAALRTCPLHFFLLQVLLAWSLTLGFPVNPGYRWFRRLPQCPLADGELRCFSSTVDFMDFIWYFTVIFYVFTCFVYMFFIWFYTILTNQRWGFKWDYRGSTWISHVPFGLLCFFVGCVLELSCMIARSHLQMSALGRPEPGMLNRSVLHLVNLVHGPRVSSVRCSRSLVRPLVAAAQLVEMYEVWARTERHGRLVLVRCHFLRLQSGCHFHICVSSKIKSLQYFTVTLWSEVVWTCLNQTWTTKGQPCGRILPQERFWHNVWRNLSFPVTWRRQLHFPGALFPPHEVERLSLPSHQENLNWLDRNDRNCLQSQTSFIQLVVSRGFYAVWFIFLITTYHC